MPERFSRGTVFIIDDDEAMRDALRALFEARGISAECFDSGDAFRARHDTSCRGCLIIDLNLSGRSGLEVLEVLLAQGYRLPTLVLSANLRGEFKARAASAGAVACIDKPFEPNHLVETVQSVMATRL